MNLSSGEMERKWMGFWEKEKIFSFNPKSKKKVFSIDTPPPTVSGKMHMGHAFSYSQSDFIARYKRMKGFEVFYPFGTDDNGLPTERLVEKLKDVRSKSMSRTEFIELCLKTLKEILPDFVQDWKNAGMSCDFDVYYSTIDKHAQKISQRSFIELFKKNLIYKENFPTIYCPECQTPIAQAELEDRSLPSKFNTVVFSAGGKDLLIATTRPELIGACVAIFVNPKDKRYKNLIGKKARVPLYNYEVPIIGDESASMEKGTGALMVCSYGDKYDVDAIKRNKLEPRIIFGSDGRLNDGRCNGLKIKQARTKILEDLQKEGLLREQKDIEHNVNVHDKCGTEIEFLPVQQWFVKILERKMELINNGRKIKWHPQFMFKRYENWVLGLEWDWSISRERHFGIPLPVWSCECGEIILPSEKELPVDPVALGPRKCPQCKKMAEPEKKVLDTWATSSLTPQIASEIVDGKVKIPFSLRTQAHDIIRTWAFYTIVKSLYHENKIPWNEIVISGFSLLRGAKMSKSLGNVVEPQKIIEQFGADALRYWAASSKLGEDVEYNEKDLVAGKKFVTKMLNAANFLFMNLSWDGKKPSKLVEADRLFLSELNRMISASSEAFESYNYSRAKYEVDGFFWKTFTDNYLEIVKKRVYNGTEMEKKSAFYALYQGLFAILRIFSPFTPFVCEEVYQKHFRKLEKEKSVHLCSWPTVIGIAEHKHDAKNWNKMLEVIARVRQAKSDAKKSMNSPIKLILSKSEIKELSDVLEDLKGVTCAAEVEDGKFGIEFL